MQNKIVFLSRLFHPHKGGVERHVFELSKCLIDQGYQITVITEQYEDNLPLEEIWNEINIIRIPYPAIQTKRTLWSWMLLHEKLFTQADIIHIHDVYWWYWPLRFKLFNRPTYITFHGYEGNHPPTWKAFAQRKAAELASKGSICIGDFMRRWYHADPDLVLYGAADLLPAKTRMNGLQMIKRLVGLVSNHNDSSTLNNQTAVFWGRLDYDTGIDIYLEAIKELPHLTLDVYGDGPLRNSLHLHKNVTLHPWQENVSQIIGNHRYAFVSRYLSILEAMQAKLLVAAVYNNDIKQDYVNCHPMHASMITAGSADELVFKLKHLTHEQEHHMIETAYAWAKEQTWNQLTQKYLQLWDQ